jgi:hypothetical protein
VTTHNGIPPTQIAELEGLQYQAAQARGELCGTVAALAVKAAHRPSGRQLAWRMTAAATRRLIAAARPVVTKQGSPGGRPSGPAYGWALPAALAAGTVAAGLLAAGAVRHSRRAGRSASTAPTARRPGRG